MLFLFISWVSVVQLQVRGPHVARHCVFSGPRKHLGKIFKSEIGWKACELHLSHSYICLIELLVLDKVHFHKNNE